MSRTSIVALRGRRVWDSRGRPTVEAEVTLAGGATGRAMAPAGASRGAHEAIDLRDGGERFGGLGVERAVAFDDGDLQRGLAPLHQQREVQARRAAANAQDALQGGFHV